MAYIDNPLKVFNQRNPFIILLKQTYQQLIDNIQEFAKKTLAYSITGIGINVIALIIILIRYFVKKPDNITAYWALVGLSLAVLICSINSLVSNIRGFKKILYEDPRMKKFEELSNSEFDDAVKLNEEAIVNTRVQLADLAGYIKGKCDEYLEYARTVLLFEFLLICAMMIILSGR